MRFSFFVFVFFVHFVTLQVLKTKVASVTAAGLVVGLFSSLPPPPYFVTFVHFFVSLYFILFFSREIVRV